MCLQMHWKLTTSGTLPHVRHYPRCMRKPPNSSAEQQLNVVESFFEQPGAGRVLQTCPYTFASLSTLWPYRLAWRVCNCLYQIFLVELRTKIGLSDRRYLLHLARVAHRGSYEEWNRCLTRYQARSRTGFALVLREFYVWSTIFLHGSLFCFFFKCPHCKRYSICPHSVSDFDVLCSVAIAVVAG